MPDSLAFFEDEIGKSESILKFGGKGGGMGIEAFWALFTFDTPESSITYVEDCSGGTGVDDLGTGGGGGGTRGLVNDLHRFIFLLPVISLTLLVEEEVPEDELEKLENPESTELGPLVVDSLNLLSFEA